jgi:hypothetical protein
MHALGRPQQASKQHILYYLTPEEKKLRINVRQFMENEVAPIVPKVLLHLVHWFICAYSIYPFFSNVILVLADA